MPTLPRFTLNQKLGSVAAVLGLVAIPASPYPGPRVTFDPGELAVEIAREADHVEPLDLADWIIKGRADYRLVDIRGDKEFAEYYIPTAEHVPLASLLDRGFDREDRIVLYSDGGIHAAQAWMLLRARGYPSVYALRGGLDAWKEQVLFPTLAEHPTPFQAERNRRLEAVSAFFGGSAQLGGAPVDPQARRALPKVEPPPPAAGGAARPKKKKEGC